MKISHGYPAVLFLILTVSAFGMITPLVVQAQALDTANTCGNAKLEGKEACDDGNTATNDGCDSQCLREIANGVCGNGTIDKTEQCDDGNNASGDNCTADCRQEFCHDGNGGYLTTLDTAYYAGVACPSTAQPQPISNPNPVGDATLTCASGEAATEGLCVVDKDSQLKCFSKDANAEIITAGTVMGTVTDVKVVGVGGLVVATANNGIHVVNTTDGSYFQHLLFEQTGAVKSLAVSKDHLLFLNDKNEIRASKEPRKAELIYTFNADDKLVALAATLIDNVVYALKADGAIKILHIDTNGVLVAEEDIPATKSLDNPLTLSATDMIATVIQDMMQKEVYKKTLFIVDSINKQVLKIVDPRVEAKMEIVVSGLAFNPSAIAQIKEEFLLTDNAIADTIFGITKKELQAELSIKEYPLTGIAKPDKMIATPLCGFATIDTRPPVMAQVCPEYSAFNPDSNRCECETGYSWQLALDTNEGACLAIVALEPFCPLDSTLSKVTGKCECNMGFMGSIGTDDFGNPILICTAESTPTDPLAKDPLVKDPFVIDPIAKDPSDIKPANPIDTVKTCPDGLMYSDVTLKCECPTGYRVVAMDSTLSCEVIANVEPLCPENSVFDTSKKRCECTTGYIMQALDNSIACVENPQNPVDPNVPTKTDTTECSVDKTLWDDDLADCVCAEGLVAIRDYDGAITRCIDPKDSCGYQGDNTTMTNISTTNTNTNTNTNNTNTDKVINVANTNNNTNTNMPPTGGTQTTPTPSSSNSQSTTPSTTPSSSVSSSSNSGSSGNSTSSGNSISSGSSSSSSSSSFTDAVNNTFTPATATADSAGGDSVDGTIDVGVNSDPDVIPDETEDLINDGTADEIKNSGGGIANIEGGALACSLTQMGTGSSHHESLLGLMVLMMLVSLRLVQRRIY